ncbi:MAG TPA: stalk domain-containing protein [Pseudobacteroides sp.]|uniref:stalk domain-containing protein n=1 Tax=Pseudobacteroides sp. TaxID=1968840 RepID=UPI002F92CDA1
MRKLKKVSLVTLVVLITSVIAAGMVWSVSTTRKVDATANDSIKVYYDGQLKTFTENDGSKISPVIINGRTYLPLRAIADLVGLGVNWEDATQSIKLTSGNSGIPDKDNTPVQIQPGATKAPETTPVLGTPAPASTSKNAGTLSDPIKLGETYSWSATEKYINSTISANYSYTVKKVEPVTLEEITKLGVKPDAKFDYAMVTVEQKVSNAKINSGDAYISSAFRRSIWGSKTPSGDGVIGGIDFGFDGSLDEVSDNVTKDSQGLLGKIKAGEAKSFTCEGKIILPLTKGKESYLVITKDSSLEYSVRHLYFRLK